MKTFMATCVLALAAGAAHAKSAKCELTIAGETYIDGPCEFESLGSGDGSFMFSAENGFFVYANRDGEQMRGSWNGVYKDSHAHDDLGMLNRDGACWVNQTARVCAW